MEQDYAIKLCDDLCDVINKNPLPISIKYFIAKDFFNEVEMTYYQYRQSIQKVEDKETSESLEVTVPVYDEEVVEDE